MIKVGIVTINDFDNYGNRLQNYALQEFLKSQNLEPITLKNDHSCNTKKNFLLRRIKFIFKRKPYSNNKGRMKRFYEFNKYIDFSKKMITPYSKLDDFDYFIVGSDQVWNPNFGRLRDVDLLCFAEDKQKISFAASFGTVDLSDSKMNEIKKGLNSFKSLSVREDAGKEIVQKITKRNDVEVLIDPTMLLSNNDWDKVIKAPNEIYSLNNRKYILNYFLGNLSENRKKEIERIANQYKCEIINLLDENSPFYQTGPSEFLYLEKNAFLICTDSFHSSVFAMLFDKPFIIFDREEEKMNNMSSRLDTLISKFELKNRKYNGQNITIENINHDYSRAYQILDREREKSIRFIKKAIDYMDCE